MTLALLSLPLIAILLCLPAYIVSRRNGKESIWLLLATLPPIIIWILLTSLGYGAQSLSNIIEVFFILIAGIVLCYVKVFILDRKIKKPKISTYSLVVLLIIGAILLRTFMPVLPE